MVGYLVARASKNRVSQVANDDIKGALSLLQLGSCIVYDEMQAGICEGLLVGLQVLLTEVADYLRTQALIIGP